MSNKRPLYDNIIVKLEEQQKVSAGGLIIPTGDLDTVMKGVILEVGDGVRLKSGDIMPLSVKPGERVIFPKDKGVKMKIDDVDVVLIRETELYGVIDNE